MVLLAKEKDQNIDLQVEVQGKPETVAPNADDVSDVEQDDNGINDGHEDNNDNAGDDDHGNAHDESDNDEHKKNDVDDVNCDVPKVKDHEEDSAVETEPSFMNDSDLTYDDL